MFDEVTLKYKLVLVLIFVLSYTVSPLGWFDICET